MTVGNIPKKQNISDWLKLCKPEKPIETDENKPLKKIKNVHTARIRRF